jgi:hypothetical protein
MTKNRVRIDEAALQRAIQPGIDRIQDQMNEQLRTAIAQVRDEMQGQPADEVFEVLVQRLKADIPGFKVNEQAMRGVATEIEAGTLS